ncbi:MAG: hypothetical protein LBO07_04470 [Coriobacteriales bacterium]|jgi:hypothetical protein|nr:hypothetical protein [Coriobacteriales bacterium]
MAHLLCGNISPYYIVEVEPSDARRSPAKRCCRDAVTMFPEIECENSMRPHTPMIRQMKLMDSYRKVFIKPGTHFANASKTSRYSSTNSSAHAGSFCSSAVSAGL